MALERFDAGAIATIDGGRIAEAINQAIGRAQRDCEDRPGLGKARTVTLTISLVPVMGPSELDSITVGFNIGEKVPGREGKSVNMLAARDGLKFQELSPEDVDQTTIEPGPALNKPPEPKKGGSRAG